MLPEESAWTAGWRGLAALSRSPEPLLLSDPGLPRQPVCHCLLRKLKLNLWVPSDVERCSSPVPAQHALKNILRNFGGSFYSLSGHNASAFASKRCVC